jgi:succinate-acetate transporter protein
MAHDLEANSRTSYERFVEFERLMKFYPRGNGGTNATPLGFCAFALTLFVYSMYLCGATVPLAVSPAGAMGLALFYGGFVQIIAGIFELRSGNNFHGLIFCSYGGYWLGLASLYVTGSFDFFSTPANTATNTLLSVSDASTQSKALAIFYLGWTIFTLAMLISSIRTNVVLIVFFFFLMATYALFTASYYLIYDPNTARAGGACGIFTAVLAWFIGFSNLLKKGENFYIDLPNYSLAPSTQGAAFTKRPVKIQGN